MCYTISTAFPPTVVTPATPASVVSTPKTEEYLFDFASGAL